MKRDIEAQCGAPASAKTMNGVPAATQEEPAPKRGGVDVWPLVIADVRKRGRVALAGDMNDRNAEGTRKYGTPLQTNNGRRALVDAYQESLDLVVYLRQALAEKSVDVNAGRMDDDDSRNTTIAYFDALDLCERLRSFAAKGGAA